MSRRLGGLGGGREEVSSLVNRSCRQETGLPVSGPVRIYVNIFVKKSLSLYILLRSRKFNNITRLKVKFPLIKLFSLTTPRFLKINLKKGVGGTHKKTSRRSRRSNTTQTQVTLL